MTTVQRIPVIDLQDFPAQSPELINACQEWGCFRIINHHTILPQSLMSEMKAVVRSLLDLPAEIKSRNVDVIAGSGYVGPTQINPLYEALGLYDMASTKAVELFCSQLNASPHQRDTIVRYAAAVHKIFMDIGSKLAEGLGLKGVSFEDWPCQFRINKYNFTPESVGSSGVQIHTDSGFLTILQDDEGVGGLEVMNKSEEFIAVDPWPGTLLVNLGDIATAWSNGRFCNVKHRVQCKEATVRVSIASFLLGPKKEVEPPPELVDTDQPRLYVPFTYEEFRKMRIMNKMHAGEALALVVVVVKEFTPSDHGSVHLVLKDPTDTIDAYIADKVVRDSEGGSDIGVGAVLILTQAVIWSPSRSKKILNIVTSNVSKVFPKDC